MQSRDCMLLAFTRCPNIRDKGCSDVGCYEGVHYFAQMATSYGCLTMLDVRKSRGDQIDFLGRRSTSRRLSDCGRWLIHIARADGIDLEHLATF